MDCILEVEKLSLSFGGLDVLRNVTLGASRGKITALIGPNGAGKTALLNCISGIYRAQGGGISFDGHDLIGRPPHEIARLGIARSFQNLELFPSLTVIENLLVAREPRFRGNVLSAAIFFGPARRREIAEREAVENVIDFFELWPLRHVRAPCLRANRRSWDLRAPWRPIRNCCCWTSPAAASPATRRRISPASSFGCASIGRSQFSGSSTICRWSAISPTVCMCSISANASQADRRMRSSSCPP